MSVAAVRARGWVYDLLTHNYAEHGRIARAVTRKNMGIPDQTDLPYPGSIAGNHVTHNYFAPPEPPEAPTPATNSEPASPTTDGVAPTPAAKWRGVREQQLTDGSWVIIKTTPPVFGSEAEAQAAV